VNAVTKLRVLLNAEKALIGFMTGGLSNSARSRKVRSLQGVTRHGTRIGAACVWKQGGDVSACHDNIKKELRR
jgi:queuine/archaeosine tRNA-ribosyltransferase